MSAMAKRLSGTLITVTFSGTSTGSSTISAAAPFAATSFAKLCPSALAPRTQMKRVLGVTFRES